MVAVGDKVTAAWGNSVRVRYIKKAASQTITNSSVFANDSDFSLTLDANKVYEIRLQAVVTGPQLADVKFQWVVTGGVAALTNRHCMGPAGSVTDALVTSMRSNGAPGLGTGVSYGTDGTNGSRIEENFLVETTTAGTTGTLTLQWAQNTANATGTAMNVNSYMIITQIEP